MTLTEKLAEIEKRAEAGKYPVKDVFKDIPLLLELVKRMKRALEKYSRQFVLNGKLYINAKWIEGAILDGEFDSGECAKKCLAECEDVTDKK